MLKLPITYTNFNGEELTEDFYFNLTTAELAEMELGANGTFQEKLQSVIDSNDGQLIIDTFKDLVNRTYGEKSDDGKRFVKDKSLSAAFEFTAAYDIFFMRLVTDAGFAADFVNSVMPNDLSRQVKASQAEEARARSEASLQGHLQKPTPSEFQQVDTPPIVENHGQPPVTDANQPFVAPPGVQIVDVASAYPDFPSRREIRDTNFTD